MGGVTRSPLAGPASYDDQDRLITLGTTTYQHSPDGERTKKNAITYTHNAEGQLEKVVNGATTIDYVLDPFGRRVARKKNGTVTHRFLWGSALGPIAEVDASGNVVTRYVYGTRANVPDFMVKGSQVLRLVTDMRGSVRLVVDVATGAVMQHIDYDEWGKQTLNSSPGLQPFGFAGGLSDDETGLVRFGARDYDPEVGRWVTKDPIGFDGGMNVYVYAANDPVNLVDHDGNEVGVAYPDIVWAALKALEAYNGRSVAADLEVAGLIYFDPRTGGYFHTPGYWGWVTASGQMSDPFAAYQDIPQGCIAIADFHTHGGKTRTKRTVAVAGRVPTEPNPFSDPDVRAVEYRSASGLWFSFLGTANGYVGILVGQNMKAKAEHYFGWGTMFVGTDVPFFHGISPIRAHPKHPMF